MRKVLSLLLAVVVILAAATAVAADPLPGGTGGNSVTPTEPAK